MENFAAPARPIVAAMTDAAAAAPDRAVAFQGAPGANSHVAALEAFPDGLPLPCFSFEDAIDAVKQGQADCAVIPIENSLHGRVADMHFLLPELGLVITGEHFLPIRYALMGLGADRRREGSDEPSPGARPVPPLAEGARHRADLLSRHRGRRRVGRRAERPDGRRARAAAGGQITGSKRWQATSPMPSTTPRASSPWRAAAAR